MKPNAYWTSPLCRAHPPVAFLNRGRKVAAVSREIRRRRLRALYYYVYLTAILAYNIIITYLGEFDITGGCRLDRYGRRYHSS